MEKDFGADFSSDEFRAGDFWAAGFPVDVFLIVNFLLFSVRFNNVDFPEMTWLLIRDGFKGEGFNPSPPQSVALWVLIHWRRGGNIQHY
ncbi:MAG: hypothetical protein IID17_04685 [Nitrospinae bacterium]|nr:hypothetical protein [Nitrospinota bacterium]